MSIFRAGELIKKFALQALELDAVLGIHIVDKIII